MTTCYIEIDTDTEAKIVMPSACHWQSHWLWNWCWHWFWHCQWHNRALTLIRQWYWHWHCICLFWFSSYFADILQFLEPARYSFPFQVQFSGSKHPSRVRATTSPLLWKENKRFCPLYWFARIFFLLFFLIRIIFCITCYVYMVFLLE